LIIDSGAPNGDALISEKNPHYRAPAMWNL
jgi:hypothetical protein